jgi:hypothetical protein
MTTVPAPLRSRRRMTASASPSGSDRRRQTVWVVSTHECRAACDGERCEDHTVAVCATEARAKKVERKLRLKHLYETVRFEDVGDETDKDGKPLWREVTGKLNQECELVDPTNDDIFEDMFDQYCTGNDSEMTFLVYECDLQQDGDSDKEGDSEKEEGEIDEEEGEEQAQKKRKTSEE